MGGLIEVNNSRGGVWRCAFETQKYVVETMSPGRTIRLHSILFVAMKMTMVTVFPDASHSI